MISLTIESVPKSLSGVPASLPAALVPFCSSTVASDAKTFVSLEKLALNIDIETTSYNPANIIFIDFVFILLFPFRIMFYT